jgi:hypothetical protein
MQQCLSCYEFITAYRTKPHFLDAFIPHYQMSSLMSIAISFLVSSSGILTVCNLLNRTILIDMDVQPLRLVIHGAHRVGLENTVFLGEVGLRKGLRYCQHYSILKGTTPKTGEWQ